jgi:chromosome segregation ATPase
LLATKTKDKPQRPTIAESAAAVDLNALVDEARAEYRNAVIQFAKGEAEPTPKRLRELCVAHGRSLEDFQADVQVLMERLAAAETGREAEDLTPKIQSADAEVNKVGEELRELQRQYNAARESLIARVKAAEAEAQGLAGRKNELLRKASETLRSTADPEIDKLRQAGTKQLHDSAREVAIARQRAREAEATLKAATAEAERAEGKPDRFNVQRRLKHGERMAAITAKRLAELEAAQKEILLTAADLQRRKEDPVAGMPWRS